jgi:predicted acetyltransferase
MGQGTLAFTNRLLLRVFTCNSFGLRQLTVICTSSNIHSIHLIQKNSTPYNRMQ